MAAATRAFSASRQHPQLERCSLFKGNEWNTLYTEAETLVKANCTVFEDSIRHELLKRTL
ncbi:uncharacterized protein PG998_014221 [Apiospora kogelbergensis]|uniref:uncharacterized protein n=1 Tax=Apiospora kogelbergensis TaxID=1337665 RepID=UPI0031320A89